MKTVKEDYLRFIGDNLRARRQSLGVSQEAFADAIGMHRTYYSAVERGEKNVTVMTLRKLARGLRIPPANILSGIEPCE